MRRLESSCLLVAHDFWMRSLDLIDFGEEVGNIK